MGKRDDFEKRASECDRSGHKWQPVYDSEGNIKGKICTRCSATEGDVS